MLKLLLILTILNCALATKKEEYVCSLQARVDGFVIKECFNWWDPNYPNALSFGLPNVNRYLISFGGEYSQPSSQPSFGK